MNPSYHIIYSNRKSIAIEINTDLTVLVRAPLGIRTKDLSTFVEAHQSWISKAIIRMECRNMRTPTPSTEEEACLRKRAKESLPERVAYYAEQMQLHPAGVRITGAKTRFGSCSGKNMLCFSWRLMAYPQEAIDYVVVHELAHILHKNHGTAFYDCIATYLPDWKKRRRLLRRD